MTQERLGLGELLRGLGKELGEDHVSAFAASLAYRALLALFPFSILVLSLLSIFQAQNALNDLLNTIGPALPTSIAQTLRDQVFILTGGEPSGAVSIAAVSATLLALWALSGAFRAVMESMNVMYEVEEARSFVNKYVRSLVMAVGSVVLFVSALALVVAGPRIARFVAELAHLPDVFVTAWTILQWPVLVLFVMLAFALIYYLAPAVEQTFRFVSPGSVVAVISWLAFSLLFSLYANNFGSYNKAYGALAGVVVLMLYMYWSSFLMLVGAEINQLIEQANPRGKDAGEREPHGRRAETSRGGEEPRGSGPSAASTQGVLRAAMRDAPGQSDNGNGRRSDH